MFDIQNYLTPEGKDPYAQWLISLNDRQARARILVRVGRMASGNFETSNLLEMVSGRRALIGGRATVFTTRKRVNG